ncbi:MAG: NAD(P)H-dependent oxidoreductase [Rhizomicrobium sp.]
MNILHIDSSILGANSASREVSSAIVARLKKASESATVVYRDLAREPLSHLSAEHLAAAQGATPEAPAVQKDVARSLAALEEFLAADIVVIGAPMYNFTISSQLKAWIDRILVAGKTFRYGPNGPEGLAGGKRVVVALSVEACMAPVRPAAPLGACRNLFARGVFGFIGVKNLEFVLAEGLMIGPDQRQKSMEGALNTAQNLRAA